MIIIQCEEFQKWITRYQDFMLRGSLKPLNNFASFFHVHEHNFTFKLACIWEDFINETIADFQEEKNVLYFAKNSDYLEIRESEAVYEVNLNIEKHMGKVIFHMNNLDFNTYILLPTRIFLPKLNLRVSKDQFEIIYSQNKHGIGVEDSLNENIKKPFNDSFYFNKPFFIYIYIDMINVLSIYVERTHN